MKGVLFYFWSQSEHKSLIAKSLCFKPAIRQVYAFFLKQVLNNVIKKPKTVRLLTTKLPQWTTTNQWPL